MKVCCLLLMLITALPAYSDDIEVTIYVDDAYAPFSFRDKGQAKGMYIDVLRTAFSRMEGFRVTMKPVPWERGKHLMKQGEGLGLAPVFFHGHDWPYVFPYSQPFYTETIQAVCNEKVLSRPRPNWPEDYIGLTVGNVMGFDGWGGFEFWALVAEKKIEYEGVRGIKSHILKLAKNRVDCIMVEERAFEYVMREFREKGKYKHDMEPLKKGAHIGTDPVYIGYSKLALEEGKYPFQLEFMQAFDSEIYKMIKAGEITEIMDAYQE